MTWDSLSHEILSLIISRLLAADIVAFHAVCKWWSETPLPTTPLILPTSVRSFYRDPPFLLLPTNKLFHPIYKYSHHERVCDVSDTNAVFRASHWGWLLMTKYKHEIFLFNPFKNEKVELPDMPFTHNWPNMTFSSPPTSPDCLIFGVQREPCGNNKLMNIYTIKPGQTNWKRHTFPYRPYFKLSSCNPVLFKSLYYCLGKGGSLLIYDPIRNKPRWFGPPEPSLGCGQSILDCQYYMVESQGRLLLVYVDSEGEWVKVARYTTKRSIWEKISSLGGTTLFISQVTSFSSRSSARGTANKIFFPMLVGPNGDNQVFYSLRTHKYHSFFGDRSWKKIHETTSWKNFDQIRSRSYANSAWIKPYLD